MSSSRAGELSETCDDSVQEPPLVGTTRANEPSPIPASQTPLRTRDFAGEPSLIPQNDVPPSTPPISTVLHAEAPSTSPHDIFLSPLRHRGSTSDTDPVRSGKSLADSFDEDRSPSPAPASPVAAPIPDADALQAWAELRSLRANVIKMRVDKLQQVEALRRHRHLVHTHETELLEHVIQLFDSQPGSSTEDLRRMLESLRQQRNEYTLLEDACDKTEDGIIHTEWRMARIEDRFYSMEEDDPGFLAAFEKTAPYRRGGEDDREDTESTASVSRIRDDPSPTAKLYLSRLGDRDLLRERLDSLRSERAYLEAERSRREVLGLSLDEDSLQTLAEFDKNHTDFMAELSGVEADLEELHGQLYNRDSQPVSPLTTNVSADVKQSPTTGTMHEVQLSATEQDMFRPLREKFKAPFFDNSQDATGMSKFINDWLLYNLQLLDSEKQLYLRLSDDLNLGLRSSALGQQILDCWYEDVPADAFVAAQRIGSWSHGRSLRATLDETQMNTAQSDTPLMRRRRNLPLLQTNAHTPAISIIARAMEERASSGMTVL